jgi:hypothetical protein
LAKNVEKLKKTEQSKHLQAAIEPEERKRKASKQRREHHQTLEKGQGQPEVQLAPQGTPLIKTAFH